MKTKTNRIFLPLVAAAAAMLGLSGCSDDFKYDIGEGEGSLVLRASISSDVVVRSRAAHTDDALASTAIIWISNQKGVVRKYKGVSEIPVGAIPLLSDKYVVEGWAGDSVSASFTDRYFKGREEVTITKGTTQQVNLTCRIANVVASVKYEDSLSDVLTDCSMEVGTSRGKLNYDATTPANQKGYFMMPSTDKDLTWTLTGKQVDGSTYTKTGTIKDARPATHYILTVKYNAQVLDPIGGAAIQVTVDATELEVNDEILIDAAPHVRGINFELTEGLKGEPNNMDRMALWIQGTAALTEAEFSCPGLGGILGISGDDFEIFAMTDAVKETLHNDGMEYSVTNHGNTGFSEMKIVWSAQMMNRFPEGEYTLRFRVKDANGRQTIHNIPVLITAATMQTDDVNGADTWARKTTLRGRVLADGQTALGFQWRKAGTQQWETLATDAAGLTNGQTFTAELTGLEPGETYEYRAISAECDKASVKQFTTEAAQQIENAGFETWNTSGKAYLLASDADHLYWDTGNHGSSTMNKNVTTPDSDVKHSGNYSAKLSSQFVGLGIIGKFAAGNAFIGKYLKTDGTDGVLGWGRPFTSRPTALKGYIKYRPKTVEYDKDDYSKLKKGDMDKGIIYIAIVDDTKTDFDGSAWPQIVKTKPAERQLFDSNGANVIAYGEKIWDSDTAGDGMVEFEIPLEYRTNSKKACNIILVCAASMGGDYFVGGPSVMNIDDFELVY